MMRNILYIVVHCSANKEGSTLRLADIDRLHKANGWNGCGYHYVIPTDGTIEEGRPVEEVGAHCYPFNKCSIGVCYIGGLAADGHSPCDTRTPAQKESLRNLLRQLHEQYPNALIRGHRDMGANKDCPCFDARKEYWDLQPECD